MRATCQRTPLPSPQFVYVMQTFAASPMQDLHSLYKVSSLHTLQHTTQLCMTPIPLLLSCATVLWIRQEIDSILL